jgi:hypothetical protein
MIERSKPMFSRVIVVTGLLLGLAGVAASPAYAGGGGCKGCNLPPSKVVRTYSDVWHKKKVINHRVVLHRTKVKNHNKLILYKHIRRHHHPKVHVTTYVHKLTILHKHNTYKKHVKRDVHLKPEITRVTRHEYPKPRHIHKYYTYDCGCGKKGYY